MPEPSEGGRTDVLAFYLPQFHPIPENDQWWGPGFTEWTNVTRARPVFPGHYQPHEPADLGYYDLRLNAVREAQEDLAQRHGISAFAYYHYWFNGRRVLEKPLQAKLASSSATMPFCLTWANENWTRRWDGQDREVLLHQEYSYYDDIRHIESLRPALTDPRYFHINGLPLLMIYKASLLPDARRVTDLWRERAASWGLPGLHLARVESAPSEAGDPRPLGFDSAVEFQPRWGDMPRAYLAVKLARRLWGSRGPFRHDVIDYQEFVDAMLDLPLPDHPRWPCVTPSWDNTARRKRDGLVLHRSSPEVFERWATEVVRRSRRHTGEGQGLVFVNAWNEWAEGAHLEPDARHGLGYVEALQRALGTGQA